MTNVWTRRVKRVIFKKPHVRSAQILARRSGAPGWKEEHMQTPTEPRSRPFAVMYLRVSTREQAERDGDPEGYSIPAQREANQRKAEAIGADIISEFVDRGESARSADRPELKRMLQFVRENPVDYCIVHKVDRLARNRADDVEINMALRAAGVQLVSATENIDETPSGTLLHGIMSSIAEFYSRNLAAEVSKGMSQKAKAGGTVTRAPLGYRNVHSADDQGRETRSVEIDKERAPLVAWAFDRYAEGDITLAELTDQMNARGLSTAPTATRASKPILVTQLQKILKNPYYKGIVVYRGATYPGRHDPLVSAGLWEKVQGVLSTRQNGEKIRRHHHYLKSSIFCGSCKSRLIVQHSTNRHGNTYEYFVCLGRHQKRTNCQMSAVSIDQVERHVVDYYKSLALPPELRETLQTALTEQLKQITTESRVEKQELERQQRTLEDKRKKLLEAHYASAIPLDLFKSEQASIARTMATIGERLESFDATATELADYLDAALSLAQDCYEAYRRGTPQQRRMINQAMFERLYIHDDADVDGVLAEPFNALLDAETLAIAARHDPAKRALENRKTRLPPDGENRVHRLGQGSKEPVMVELRGIEPLTFSLRTRRATNCATAPQAANRLPLAGGPMRSAGACARGSRRASQWTGARPQRRLACASLHPPRACLQRGSQPARLPPGPLL